MARKTEARQVMTGAVAYRDGFEAITLSADRVLTARDAQFLRVDPNGSSRNVDLPGVDGDNLMAGEFIEVVNVGTGGENIALRQPGGASTVATVTPGDRAKVYFNGTIWVLYFLDVGGYS